MHYQGEMLGNATTTSDSVLLLLNEIQCMRLVIVRMSWYEHAIGLYEHSLVTLQDENIAWSSPHTGWVIW